MRRRSAILPIVLSAVIGTTVSGRAFAPVTPQQAATDAAIAGLAEQVDRLPLGGTRSVGQYLDRVKGHPYMNATLQRAQVVGGARQLAAGVVQVRLDITGRVVADALTQIAAVNVRNPNNLKVTPELVQRESRAWANNTFTAIGTSNGQPAAAPVPAVPAPAPAAVDAAKLSAVQDLLKRVGTVPATPNKGTRDLLALPGVSDAVIAFVVRSPVRSVDARPNGEVDVVLTVDGAALFDALRTAATKANAGLDDKAWATYREGFLPNVPAELKGVALPQPSTLPAAPESVSIATNQVPDWYFQSLEVSATARNAGSKLVTGGLAEDQARAELAKLLESLPLGGSLTLGAAAKKDPRFQAPLARALDNARVFKVEYLEDGSANVKVTTDARYLWQDIVAAAQTKP